MSDTVEIPVVWLQGAACTGCAVSLLNSFAPGAVALVLRELAPGKHVSLRFIAPVMAAQGAAATQVMKDEAAKDKGKYVLVMEGSVPTGSDLFAIVGGIGQEEYSCYEMAAKLAKNAMAVVAMGTCASFGGIPAGQPNPTGCIPMSELLKREKISTPLLNIPGCPPHPDWLVGTLVAVIRYGLDAVEVDELARPKMFYGRNIHETCQRRADFDAGRFAKKFGDAGCLYELGCKGPITAADCPTRMWNSGTNWCIGAGHPCHGCVEPEFPDRNAPLYLKIDMDKLGRFLLLKEPAEKA